MFEGLFGPGYGVQGLKDLQWISRIFRGVPELDLQRISKIFK